MKRWIKKYKYELLLFALMMVIFNRIFVFSADIYSRYVWPLNMILLGIVSVGIFHENKFWKIVIKNILFLIVVSVPFFSSSIFSNPVLSIIGLSAYGLFYMIIFFEVMGQIIKKFEVTTSVIMGSLSGFLLLIIISLFSYLLVDFIDASSFNSLKGISIPEKYHQLNYFSIITLTTIGYGDITPSTDNARLLAGFWGVVGQFYMVAIVGIIISKFTSNK